MKNPKFGIQYYFLVLSDFFGNALKWLQLILGFSMIIKANHAAIKELIIATNMTITSVDILMGKNLRIKLAEAPVIGLCSKYKL